jgi:vacuolar protein sorting-associated protein 45
LQKEVYLLERVANTAREVMTHLKAIVFVRPTQESLDALVAELKRPKYGSYDIYFSNIIKPTQLERLAEADEHEVVQEVQEYFADYLACGSSLVHFGLRGVVDSANPTKWDTKSFNRVSQGLVALMLSLKRRPVIRYQASSDMCHDLAKTISGTIERERGSLFDFRQTDPAPVMVVVDRRDDPVTPLLNQWTYQAQVHELLGIERNRVSLKGVPGIAKDLEQVVLSEKQDTFYRDNMFKNFGEIGDSIKRMVEEFQERSKKNAKLDSIQDMKAFVESYPEFRAMSGSVSKHVSVVGEISRQVDAYNIFDLSAAEQEIACQSDHRGILDQMDQLFGDAKVRHEDLVRITMLYALRYGQAKDSELDTFVTRMIDMDVDAKLRELVSVVQEYAGNGRPGRSSNLFGETKGARGPLNPLPLSFSFSFPFPYHSVLRKKCWRTPHGAKQK